MRFLNGLGVPLALVLIGVGVYFWLQQPTKSQLAKVQQSCLDWITAEYAVGKRTKTGDQWTRRGNIVQQVLIEETANRYQVMLCVVDIDAGQMIKPSAFDTSWN